MSAEPLAQSAPTSIFTWNASLTVMSKAVSHMPEETLVQYAQYPQYAQYEGCIGVSPHAWELKAFIARAAQQLHPILLLGEAGLRQEQFARALHQASANWAQPFLAVNARGLGDEALHKLLFGDAEKAGLFDTMKGGTIFVNELTRLSPVLQQRFAVYLEERSWPHEYMAGQRLVLATEMHPEERTASNRIAYGLVDALRPHSCALKPLRERSEDIPDIARHLVARLAQRKGYGTVTLPPTTLQFLAEYSWPQNMDELEGVLQAALEQLAPQQVSEALLPAHVRFARLRSLPPTGIDMPQLLEDYECRLLATALQQAGNSQTKAAKLLGLRVQTLNMKLKRLTEQGRPLL